MVGVRLHGGLSAAACIELAALAERNAYSSLWFTENIYSRGMLPAVAGAIIATRGIRVGWGVINPYSRHPTQIAMEAAALDELCGARLAVGIGSGNGDRIRRMGLSYDKPLAAVRDAIHIVRGLLQGARVIYSGSVFSVKDVQLEHAAPRPDLPLYMAAMGDQALRVCGEVADGLIISNMCPPGFTSRASQLLREAASAAVRDAPKAMVQFMICAARKDRNEARAEARSAIAEKLVAYWNLGEKVAAVRQAMCRDSGIAEPDYVSAVDRLNAGEHPTRVLDDRFVDAYSIAGTADDCLAGAQRFGAAGATELVLSFAGAQSTEDMTYLGSALKGRS